MTPKPGLISHLLLPLSMLLESGCVLYKTENATTVRSTPSAQSLPGTIFASNQKLTAVHAVLGKYCYQCHANYKQIGIDSALTTTLVVPGRPSESKLYASIVGSGATGQGVTRFPQGMPIGATETPAASELATIDSWIRSLPPNSLASPKPSPSASPSAMPSPSPSPSPRPSPSPSTSPSPISACATTAPAGVSMVTGTTIRSGWEIWGFNGGQPTGASLSPACSHNPVLKYVATGNFDGWTLVSNGATIPSVIKVSADLYLGSPAIISMAATWPGVTDPHQFLPDSSGALAQRLAAGWSHVEFNLVQQPATTATGMVVPAPFPRTISTLLLEVQNVDPDHTGTTQTTLALDNLVFVPQGTVQPSPTPSPTPSPKPTLSFATVLSNKCISCHGTNGPYANLNRTADQLVAAGLVVARNPEASRLFYKLNGAATGRTPSEENMPMAPYANLTSAELQSVRDFINSATPSNPSPTPGPSTACTPVANTPVRIVRLSGAEMDNTLSVLFGAPVSVGPTLGADPIIAGYMNNAGGLSVSAAYINSFATSIEEVIQAKLPALQTKYPCTTSDTTLCATTFIRDFGKLAFRRPLTSQESTELAQTYLDAKSVGGGTHGAGLTGVIEAMLLSPDFIFRSELGSSTSTTAAGTVVSLTPYEVASLISYSLLSGPPDAALIAAAGGNTLSTNAQIAAQIDRLAADATAYKQLSQFIGQTLRLDLINTSNRSTSNYPNFSVSIRTKMQTEADLFIRDLYSNPGSGYSDLLSAGYSYADQELAAFYGWSGPTNATFVKVVPPASENRAGVLSLGAFLGSHANIVETSPTKRGRAVREMILCQAVPPPPPNANVTPPTITAGTTTRIRMGQHVSDATCMSCHSQMDPLGFGFEGIDAVGRFRSKDNGIQVDDSWKLEGIPAGPVSGTGSKALGTALSGLPEARACLVSQWFVYASQRAPLAADACQLSRLQSQFEASGGKLRDLMQDLLKSDLHYKRVVK